MTGGASLTRARDTGLAVTAPPPRSRVGGRWVLWVAALLIVSQLGLRGWLVAQRHYYADDLSLLDLADRYPLWSPSFLLYDFIGHLMPGALFVGGVVERVAPLEWWPAATSLIVLQALASVALLRMLWVLLGNRPVLLVPLTVGLFSPVTLGSTSWWVAALNSMPLQIGLAWLVADAVRLVQTGRRRHAVSGTVAVAFALAFYIKAVLLPPIAFAVVAVVLLRDGSRAPIRDSLRRGWVLWSGTVLVLGVWAVTYLQTRTGDPMYDGDAGEVLRTVATGFEGLAPAVLGGPFTWESGAGAPVAWPPTWAVVIGGTAALLACVWTSIRLRGAVAVWALVVGTVGSGLLMAALGRSGAGWGHVLPLAYRYFPAEAVVLPAAIALLASLPARRPRPGVQGGDGGPRSGRRWHVPVVVVLTAGFVLGSVVSTVSHNRAWQEQGTGDYLDTARASLAAAGPEPLLDQAVPTDVMWGLSAPANRSSRMFASLDDRPPFAPWTTELRMLDDTGRLRPAQVVPGPRVVDGPVPGCGWTIGADDATAVALQGPLPDAEWTAELRYAADRDGSLTVSLGPGEEVRAPVRAGTGTLYLRLDGGGATLRMTTQEPDTGLCVTGGVVGSIALR
ncbi:hypothetical protein [Blastococcus sp. SYSU DS0617]